MGLRAYLVILFVLLIAVTFCIGCTDSSNYSDKTTSKSLNTLVPDNIGKYEKVKQTDRTIFGGSPEYYIIFETTDQSLKDSDMEIQGKTRS